MITSFTLSLGNAQENVGLVGLVLESVTFNGGGATVAPTRELVVTEAVFVEPPAELVKVSVQGPSRLTL